MTERHRAARIVATLIDVACMLPWIAVVAAAGSVLYVAGTIREVPDALGNLIGFGTLIVPITLAAAGFDGTSRHATPGKRALRLRLRSAGGGPGFTRALLRNAIKCAAPWELGHTAVFALVWVDDRPAALGDDRVDRDLRDPRRVGRDAAGERSGAARLGRGDRGCRGGRGRLNDKAGGSSVRGTARFGVGAQCSLNALNVTPESDF